MQGDFLRLVYTVNLVLLAALLFSLPFVEPGSGSFIAVVASGGVIGLSLAMVIGLKRLGYGSR